MVFKCSKWLALKINLSIVDMEIDGVSEFKLRIDMELPFKFGKEENVFKIHI
jgi:hypothetical protein